MPRRRDNLQSSDPNSWHSKPRQRHDGELYSRPEPNPFTPAWEKGYEDGFDARPASVPDSYTKIDVMRYQDGYDTGREERDLIEASYSSNA